MKYTIIIAFLIFATGVYIANFRTQSSGPLAPRPTTTSAPTLTPPPTPTPFNSSDMAPTPTPAQDLVLTHPAEGGTITSPLTITGQARGTWFFEATFPVILTDWDGLIIAETYATAQDDWMTQDLVPFQATLEFEPPELYDRGQLILQKANPSGLPENDAAHEITVYF